MFPIQSLRQVMRLKTPKEILSFAKGLFLQVQRCLWQQSKAITRTIATVAMEASLLV